MQCSLTGCPGAYEARHITHTVRVRGQVIVIDQVLANVCDVVAIRCSTWTRCGG